MDFKKNIFERNSKFCPSSQRLIPAFDNVPKRESENFYTQEVQKGGLCSRGENCGGELLKVISPLRPIQA